MARPGPLVVMGDKLSATSSPTNPEDSKFCFAVGLMRSAIWCLVAVVADTQAPQTISCVHHE